MSAPELLMAAEPGCCASERWRRHHAWPHEASTCGRIRTIARTGRNGRPRLPIVLKPAPDRRPGKGYLYVMLWDGPRRRKVAVHVFVLETWAGPKPTPGHEGCHGNDIRTDNHLPNLRWDTHQANMADRARRRKAVTPPVTTPARNPLPEAVTRDKPKVRGQVGASRSPVTAGGNASRAGHAAYGTESSCHFPSFPSLLMFLTPLVRNRRCG